MLAGGLIVLTPDILRAENSPFRSPGTGKYQPSFARLRDTLYVLDTSYLEIRLNEQAIYQHFRSGHVDRYPCSTGDPRIQDGIATRQGVFTIGGRSKRTLSQQFQVYLNYWMQFDGGIGFHGLDGRSYYRYLGKRPSSHGCVRISNETGGKLFGKVRSGMVVYVHGGSPARILKFADSSLSGLQSIYDIDPIVINRRVEAIQMGRWYDSTLQMRIAISPRKNLPRKIGVGAVNSKLIVQYPIRPIALPVAAPVPSHKISPALPLPVQPNGEMGEHMFSSQSD